LLETAWSISIQDHHYPLSQHGIAYYVTKFELQQSQLQQSALPQLTEIHQQAGSDGLGAQA